MTERKFYKTTVTIEILSEDEPWDGTLEWLSYDISEGEYVGAGEWRKSEEVTAERMVTLLEEAGSDAGFFGLDEREPEVHDVDGFDITEG